MVKPAVLIALLLSTLLTPANAGVSTTAEAFLNDEQPFLGLEKIPQGEKNHLVEDFFVVTLISLPFTALYGLLGATAVDSIDQSKFPPRFQTKTLTTAGIAAVATSVLIGTFSIHWNSTKSISESKTNNSKEKH